MLIFIFVLIIILAILTICIKYLDSKTANCSNSNKYTKSADILNIVSAVLIFVIVITLIGGVINNLPEGNPFDRAREEIYKIYNSQ